MKRIAIIGLGCIGASIGQAIRSRHLAEEVIGIDLELDVGQAARRVGAVDAYGIDLQVARHADLIVVAVPPYSVAEVFQEVAPTLSEHTIVTDVTSVKLPIRQWAEEYLPFPERFVGGHPVAGSEQSGVIASSPDLFVGAYWVLTLTFKTDPQATERVQDFVKALGAIPLVMDAQAHDEHFALLSHLPHLLASTLILRAQELENPQIGGGSWRDLTRVAASSPELWKQILWMNREALQEVLEGLQQNLSQVSQWLKEEDASLLEQFLQRAHECKLRRV